ncbi:hypothetical protein ARAM_003778 [Aspergillus rambellii]|uniref:F-box domain-containing protein n=1 Tax=Aspergillus rambellii TaxID=308745 RepID=A0A0F8UYW7_9EURO|nr:hypothetical protein ARAM_003778 [Aspergillus rambellii]
MALSPVADPLRVFPPELVLRVLDFVPVSSLASLTLVSTAWHRFIDVTHQDAIYSSVSKTAQPPGSGRSLAFLSESTSFSKWYGEDTASWKELCKRQTLLARNWAQPRPSTGESLLQVGHDPVWRFRPDFKRRFFVSTSHAGGLNVTDMDTGRILWRLPSTLDTDHEHAVRPYAHLEYQDGIAVFDRDGDAVEVWQADLEGANRGQFGRIAVLDHTCQTRGFQLSYWTLCVVSSEGQGFVYDMTQRPPKLTTHMEIAHDAVGHLDQDHEIVVYSMGPQGYHVHDKASGSLLGVLQPSHCTEKYHIRPPPASSSYATATVAGAALYGPRHPVFPPRSHCRDRLVPIKVSTGPLPTPTDLEHAWHGENEWGAGMLDNDLFVGFSRAGHVFVCSDWRRALRDPASLAATSAIIECESDGSNFDLGGWLSVRNGRLMFEIQDRIYVVALDENNSVQEVNHPVRASYSLLTGSAPQLSVPVSFMSLYDDAIMTTYTTLGRRQSLFDQPGDIPEREDELVAGIFPTVLIRIVSLAPDLSHCTTSQGLATDAAQSPTGRGPWDPGQQSLPATDIRRHSERIWQSLDILGDELEEEEVDGISEYLDDQGYDGP